MVHLAAGREGICDSALCLGINNTVSRFFCGGEFGPGLSDAIVCTTVEVEEDPSMPRLRRIASRLAYFLVSCGSTGSIYLCVLYAVSRGGSVRGTGLGTTTFVTVIIPDLGVGEDVMGDVEDVWDDDEEEVADVVTDALDELDRLDELDELVGEGVDEEEREAGGRGLAEAVRGGKIVE